VGEDKEDTGINLDLFDTQALIALEQEACEEPKQNEPEEDVRQLKFRFDAALL